MDSIDSKLLNAIPSYKREIHNKDNIIAQLESDRSLLENEENLLQQEIEVLKTQINELAVSNLSNME